MTLAIPRATPDDALAFELGWDHARYAVNPALPQAYASAALRDGLVAWHASAVPRRSASRSVELWLKLRLHAWYLGQSVEPVQVTPRFIQQLEVSHCPVTRAPLDPSRTPFSEVVLARVRHDAAYAAGNLVMMSSKAERASFNVTRVQALERAQRVDATADGPGQAGLTATQWGRVATLGSFVQPLAHEQACALPLLVLPPNRIRLFNPAQALQAFVSRQLLAPGWSLRMSRIEALLPASAARCFQTFFHALLPRVLEAGRGLATHAQRWAIEDAWRQPLVQQRWAAFARHLSAAQCETLVLRAHAKRLGQGALLALNERAAVDGWGLAPPGGFTVAPSAQRDVAASAGRVPPRRPLRPESGWSLPRVASPGPHQAALPLQ
jgi:hypothetical protein